MAEKPVIVPVELEVTDLNMSGAELKKIQQTVNQTLAGLKKSVSDLFSGIDKNKAGSAIAASMQSVEKGISGALAAQTKLNAAMLQAGRSSEVFKSKVADIDTKIKTFKDQLASLDEAGLGHAVDPLRNQLTAQIEALETQKAKLNPMEYLDTATPEALLKVAEAYRKVGEAVADANKRGQQFNQTVEQNKLTDEYTRSQAAAEALKTRLEQLNEKSKKMADLGATDKQWESLEYDVQKVSAELDSTLNKMREMVKDGSAFRFDAAKEDLQKLQAQIKSINMTRTNITGSVTGRANAENPYTADYKAQLAELIKLQQASDKLVEKWERMKALGKATPENLKAAKFNAQTLSAKLEEARQKLSEMVNQGTAFRSGQGDVVAELEKVNGAINSTKESLNGISSEKASGFGARIGEFITKLREAHPAFDKFCTKAEETGDKVKPALSKIVQVGGLVGKVLGAGFRAAAQGTQVLAKGLRAVVHHLGQIVSKAFGAIKNMSLFHRAGKKTSSDLGKSFKKLQRNILMFGLGFRSAYFAIKRLRNIFFSAFKTLAQQSDDVNQQISSLVMTLNRLKGSLVSAFQPIANIAIPGLNALMDKLADTMEVMGKFFATMQGQDYIYKATAKQYDFVKSMNNKLGGYDKLSTIQDDASGLLDVTYDTESVEGAASDFAKLVKESWEKQDFTEVGKTIGNKIISMFASIKDTIGPKLSGFINNIASLITTGFDGLNVAELSAKASDAIGSILSNIDASKVGAALAKVKSALWTALSGLISTMDWGLVADKMSDLIIGFAENIDFNALATGLGKLISAIGTVLAKLVEKIDFVELANTVVDIINTVFSNIDVNKLGEGIGALIGGIITFIVTSLSQMDISSVIDAVANLANGVLTGVGNNLGGEGDGPLSGLAEIIPILQETLTALVPILKEVFSIIGSVLKDSLPVLMEILPFVSEILSAVAKIILPLISSLTKNLLPIISRLIQALLPALLKILNALEPVFQVIAEYVIPFIADLLDALMPIIEGLLNLITSILSPILQLIAPLLKIVVNILTPLLDLLRPFLDIIGYLVEIIGSALEPVLELLSPILEMINSVLEPVIGVISVVLSLLKPVFDIIKLIAGLLNGAMMACMKPIIGAIQMIINLVANLFDGLGLGVKWLKSVLGKAFDSFRNILNKIIGGFEAFINKIIGGMNWLIRSLNKISFEIPSWVPGIGGKRFGFNLKEISNVSLPRLAQGAVIPPNKEFLAMLGDQRSGTNIEAPLDTIKQALAEVLAEVGGASHDPIILQLDGRTVAKVVWAEEEKRYKQTGKSFAY